jgi:predicted alpha/beta-hydrolase family hydrolase
MIIDTPTPEGPGRLFVAPAESPQAVLMLGHGAGGGVDAMDLKLLAGYLPGEGIAVVRFEQPWRTAGRKVAVPPPRLDIGWLAAVERLWAEPDYADLPLYVGGRSAGARVACRTANAVGARGVVCLAFPLHLPGRPEKSRAPELLQPEVPRLVLQGSKDTFGSAEEVRLAAAGDPEVRVVELPDVDHGYRVPKAAAWTAADLRAELKRQVLGFIAPAGRPPE